MRTISLIPLLCFFYLNIQAQEKKAVQKIGWKGYKIELHTIGNKEQSCTVVMSMDSLKVFLTAGHGVMVPLFTIHRQVKENFLGGFLKNGNLYLFLDNGVNPGIRSCLYSFDAKSLSEYTVPFAIKDESIIHRLSSPNYFFYLTFNKKTSAFVVYKFGSENKCDTIPFSVSPSTWEDITDGNEGLFVRAKIDIEKTDMEGECDIEKAKSYHKIYVRNDSLLLLLNNQRAVTEVYTFDLVNNSMNHRSIQHLNGNDNGLLHVYNSFLLRNKLYYASASENNLFVQIVDFYSGKILKEFTAERDDDIAFKNTPITQEGGYFGKSTRTLDKTRQLLRKLTSGQLVITATPLDRENEVAIMIGSYQVVSNGGGASMMSMPGPSGVPIFIPTGGFARGSWVKSARFQMRVNAETSEHVEGEIIPSINDKIDEYTKGIKIPTEGENLFVFNGNYYYVFYNKREQELALVKF